MSQEQPPIRSRRELRKARDAQQPVPVGTEQLSPAANAPAAGPSVPGTAAAALEQTSTQRSSQIRARDRAALRTIKELEEKEGQLAAGGPPTRRQLRLQQLKEQALTAANPVVPPSSQKVVPPAPGQKDAAASAPADSGKDRADQGTRISSAAGTASVAPEGMTVEQALAARALLAEQAKNQIAKMEHIASLDPEAVDPDILAEQIALAERAAILNRRALAKQRLAEQAGTPPVPAKDPAREPGPKDQAGTAGLRTGPSTASNLAMVTPLEFVQVPGVDRPVMKPPATSHVPVTTRPGARVTAPATRKRRPAEPQRPADAGPGRSHVIARAEAAARTAARPRPLMTGENRAEDSFEDVPRVPANSAYGLEPLDAATAGLARAQRNRVLQFCILAFGIVALVSGIILIISGISR